MSDVVILRMAVLDALKRFESAIFQAQSAARRGCDFCWMDGSKNPIETLVTALGQVRYVEGQAPVTSQVFVGVVGVQRTAIEAIEQLNQTKEVLQSAIRALKGIRVPDEHGVQRDLEKIALKAAGWSRLHKLQAYRKIPIVGQTVERVGFSWIHSHKVYRTTVGEVREILLKQSCENNNPDTQADLVKLARMDDSTCLAIKKEMTPHIRANLVLEDGSRKQLRASMPIFYVLDVHGKEPAISPPGEDIRQSRLPRSDRKVATLPLLKTLPVFTYISN